VTDFAGWLLAIQERANALIQNSRTMVGFTKEFKT
jgi:hypothetical protein